MLCPAGADADAVSQAHEAWRFVGAKTVEMTPEEHDSIFGLISHLPHLLSYALVEMIEKRGDDGLRYAAGGFRDFTRIAGSHPDMWRDIFLSNADEVLAALFPIIKKRCILLFKSSKKKTANYYTKNYPPPVSCVKNG